MLPADDPLDPAALIARLIAGSDPLDQGTLDLVDELAALPEPFRPPPAVERAPSRDTTRFGDRGFAYLLAGVKAIEGLAAVRDRLGDEVCAHYPRSVLQDVVALAQKWSYYPPCPVAVSTAATA